ncbi:lectin-like domain-containing protein, partial [Lacticaseibacillus nasuensis]|uniref:lectin-like domain-containing protein n=1 Tax=Lacticaseibacillus nasuensis TaxID=944671 RepID=UPI001F337054
MILMIFKNKDQASVKERVKMWKSGKQWVFGTIFFFGLGLGVASQAHPVAAATAGEDDEPVVTTESPASTLAGKSVTLSADGQKDSGAVATSTAPAVNADKTATDSDKSEEAPVAAATDSTDSDVASDSAGQGDKQQATGETTSADTAGAQYQPATKTSQPVNSAKVSYYAEDNTAKITVDSSSASSLFVSSGVAHNYDDNGQAQITSENVPNDGYSGPQNTAGQLTLANRINMDQDFTLTGKVKVSGGSGSGDGIGIGFKTGDMSKLGETGGAMGIGGLAGAFGFKIDTNYNTDSASGNGLNYRSDTNSFVSNGSFGSFMSTSTDGSAAETTYVPSSADGSQPQAITLPSQYAPIELDYTGSKHLLTVKFDGKVWTKDISDWINGNEFMNLFISASTGASYANQNFELDSLVFTPQFFANVHAVDQDGKVLPTDPATYTINAQDAGNIDYHVVKQQIDGYAFQSFADNGDPATGTLTVDNPTATITLNYAKVGSYEITPASGQTLPAGVAATTEYQVSPITDENESSTDPQTVSNPTGFTIPGFVNFNVQAQEVKSDGTVVSSITLTPIDTTDRSKGYVAPDLSKLASISDNIVISYTPVIAVVTVKFVDQDGNEIAGHSAEEFDGTPGDAIDYNKDKTGVAIHKAISGYVLTDDGTTKPENQTYDADESKAQVVTLIYSTNGSYTITPAGSDKPGEPQTYTTDPKDPGKAAGTVPYTEGYTPTAVGGTLTPITDKATGKTTGYTLVPNDPTQPATVTYTADSGQKVMVEFVGPDNQQLHDTQEIDGVTGAEIDYSKDIKGAAINKVITGYVLTDDQTTEPENQTYDADESKAQVVTLTYSK